MAKMPDFLLFSLRLCCIYIYICFFLLLCCRCIIGRVDMKFAWRMLTKRTPRWVRECHVTWHKKNSIDSRDFGGLHDPGQIRTQPKVHLHGQTHRVERISPRIDIRFSTKSSTSQTLNSSNFPIPLVRIFSSFTFLWTFLSHLAYMASSLCMLIDVILIFISLSHCRWSRGALFPAGGNTKCQIKFETCLILNWARRKLCRYFLCSNIESVHRCCRIHSSGRLDAWRSSRLGTTAESATGHTEIGPCVRSIEACRWPVKENRSTGNIGDGNRIEA